MTIVLEAFNGRVLDFSVHAFYLTVGPRVIWLGQAMFDLVDLADHVEAHLLRKGCVSSIGLVGELDADIGQDRLDALRNDFE